MESDSTLSKIAPKSVLITMSVVVVVFGISTLSGSLGVDFQNPKFLMSQMMTNFYLIIIYAFMYGMAFQMVSDEGKFGWFRKYMYLIFPGFLMLFMFLKSWMIYSANLNAYCPKDGDSSIKRNYKMSLVLWNAVKPVISIFVVYFFVNMFQFFQLPFYELFNDSHPIIYFLAVGFWLACATFPTEASSYFSLQKFGCMPVDKITFEDINGLPDPTNPPTTTV